MDEAQSGDEVVAGHLAAERAATLDRIAALTGRFDDMVAASALTTGDDEHDPEGATIAFERAQVSALLTQARADLDALDRAGSRLTAGTYGTCQRCGNPIAPERMEILPAADTCITCARAADRRP